jgi:hypothetical protein
MIIAALLLWAGIDAAHRPGSTMPDARPGLSFGWFVLLVIALGLSPWLLTAGPGATHVSRLKRAAGRAVKPSTPHVSAPP